MALPAMLIAGVVALSGIALAGPQGKGSKSNAGSKARVMSSNLTFAERFVENKGQWDSRAKFLLKTNGLNSWVTEDGIVYDFYTLRSVKTKPLGSPRNTTRYMQSGHVVGMKFVGSNANGTVGYAGLRGKMNFLKSGVQATASVFNEAYSVNTYPGIDTRWYVDNGQPRYDLIVAPGADPSQIRMQFEGASNLRTQGNNSLVFDTSLGTKGLVGLYVYQTINGQVRPVNSSFKINADGTVSYQLGSYDQTKALVIDPVVYSTLLGGNFGGDSAFGVAVDSLTSAYVVGTTTAPAFPTSVGAYQETFALQDGFVTKFLPDGSDVEYSTLVGGTDADVCGAIALDSTGAAYVIGGTLSTDLPTLNAVQAAIGGGVDGFFLKLNNTGTAANWLTYIGGGGDDQAFGVAVDSLNQAVVVGMAGDNTFPLVSAADGTFAGDTEGFVQKYNAAGSALLFSSFMGGTEVRPSPFDPNEMNFSVAVDIDRNIYVLGQTNASNAPTTVGAFDRTANGWDNYVAKFTASGGASWATFVGGNATESPAGIALDNTANVFITGSTDSFNYPRTTAAFDRTFNNSSEGYLTKINRLGTGLIFSTFLGAVAGASPSAIAVDDIGFAHIAGFIAQSTTTAAWLPVTPNADDPTYNGPTLLGGDAYLQVVNDSGTALQYCGYLGGSANDGANGIAIDGARNAYVVGSTNSGANDTIEFPTTPGAFKETMPADAPPNFQTSLSDPFLTKIKTRIPLTIASLTIAPTAVASGESAVGTVTLSAAASTGGATVALSNNNNSIISTPASFLIPEGQTSGTFVIQTTANMTSTQTVVITATVEGDTKSAQLTVAPWLTALTLSNDTVVGGNVVGGRITLFRPAPAGGITVNMNSTVPSVATVPSTVSVPETLNTVTFDVTTRGVASPQIVDITASYAGLTRTVSLTVIPARLFSISFVPNVVSGGTDTTGKVQLDGAAPTGGVTVNLVSSDAALAVPATVIIPAQQSSATFTGTTSVVTVDTSVTVSATFGLDTRTAVVDVLRANLISLAISPDVIQGGNSTTGTVGLDAPAATGGVTIPITSSNPAVAQAPATVTVPSGSTNVNFVIPTSLVGTDTTVTFTATRGLVTLNANLLVKAVGFNVDMNPNTVVGGQASVGTVNLVEAAPTGGVSVNLSSSNTSVVTVPSTVLVPAGEISATFNASTVPVVADTNVTITGTFGAASASDVLTVTAAGPLSVALNPSSVAGGGSSIGIVTLDGVAPAGGVTVNLSSNNAAATVPATVVVPAGGLTQSFVITTIAVSTNQTATISATANGNTAQANLTIVAANLLNIRFIPSRVRGGQNTSCTIQLDAAAPPGGATITLTNSNPNVTVSFPTSATIPAGQTSVTFTVQTRRVSRVLSTQVTATYNGQTKSAILTATR
jgi:hypothetical protein